MATPPSEVTAGTRPLVLSAVGLPDFAGATGTAILVSFPVWESLLNTGPVATLPAADSRLTTAVPPVAVLPVPVLTAPLVPALIT
ncbi:MAG TPA: hypothetical protein VNH17_07365, partial [Streptosporangiaceae bacterium]|nr:hypothetical protein [Streptosporangiaceae bacterium]